MSQEKNKSFMDEIQEKYEIVGMDYTPGYHVESGLQITLKLKSERERPGCPICNGYPIVHEYKKNDKIRNNQWGTGNI